MKNKKQVSKIASFAKKAGAATKNAFTAAGRGIKKTFMEMSSGLAGWIDDASEQFKPKKKTKKASTAKASVKRASSKKAEGSTEKKKSAKGKTSGNTELVR
ncbi:MAG: hypothetical protein LBH47_03195 [Christensenellaceae bacterium]|jgi:hypothetical protein|nr:hypothetical protein [Christensenellaceae bacterium]